MFPDTSFRIERGNDGVELSTSLGDLITVRAVTRAHGFAEKDRKTMHRPRSRRRPWILSPNVRFFAGFTSSLAFQYSVMFIVRLKNFQTMLPQLGMSSFL